MNYINYGCNIIEEVFGTGKEDENGIWGAKGVCTCDEIGKCTCETKFHSTGQTKSQKNQIKFTRLTSTIPTSTTPTSTTLTPSMGSYLLGGRYTDDFQW